MPLEFGCHFNDNPVIKQRHLKDDKDKEQFSLSESIYIMTCPLKKITNNRERRYTYELQQWASESMLYISWHLSSLSG